MFGWARLLKRVVAIDPERCPRRRQGTLQIIAAITYRPVARQSRRHLKLAAAPRRLLRHA
jgi:hypothetical protein